MCLRVSFKKKIWRHFFFASLKSLKKGFGSWSGCGSVSQRVADPHQNVTDPQHCLLGRCQYCSFLSGLHKRRLRRWTRRCWRRGSPASWSSATSKLEALCFFLVAFLLGPTYHPPSVAEMATITHLLGPFPLFLSVLPPVLRIRIHRIHMFLGLHDPDPLVRGMDPDPDPDPSIIMQK